ncbi:dendrite reproteinration [Mactra antiquata]
MDKPDPMSEAEILRKHCLYQKSYVKDLKTLYPTRSTSPVNKISYPKQKKTNKDKKKQEVNKDVKPAPTKSIQKVRTSIQELEYRRSQRATRPKPWQDETPRMLSKSGPIQLFYERALPSNCDKSKINLLARKYVSNTKYGNIYQIRQVDTKRSRKTKSPEPKKWMWEDEFMLWSLGRDKYLEEIGSTRTKLPSKSGSETSTTPRTLRSGGLPVIREPGRPNAEVYATYNYHHLERGQRRRAAILLQRMFRGHYVRSVLRRLKRKAILEHGRTWTKFINEYKQLVFRIRARYGLDEQICSVDLKQVEQFMDDKCRYEKIFRKLAPIGKLPKEDLMEFFNRCDLWPTQRDIDKSFDTIFRGSRNTAEVIFALDCSTSTGIVGFHNLIKFVKNVIHMLDIGPDNTRVGMVPYNENIFSSFSITTYNNKTEIFEAISRIKLWHGLTRTDIALRRMREIFKESRPGVQKIGIVISDGNSTYQDKTRHEAQLMHEMNIKMFAIGIGNRADLVELQHIATTPDHLFHVLDVKSLDIIRRQIQKQFCLGSTYNQPIKASSCSHVCRPIVQSEALDVIWTSYPPLACQLEHVKVSRWIRPIVNGKEAWSTLDDEIIRTTGMKACLKLVIQSRLHRYGFITVPSDVTNDVEQVTNETQALQIIEKFIKDRQSLIYPISE